MATDTPFAKRMQALANAAGEIGRLEAANESLRRDIAELVHGLTVIAEAGEETWDDWVKRVHRVPNRFAIETAERARQLIQKHADPALPAPPEDKP